MYILPRVTILVLQQSHTSYNTSDIKVHMQCPNIHLIPYPSQKTHTLVYDNGDFPYHSLLCFSHISDYPLLQKKNAGDIQQSLY